MIRLDRVTRAYPGGVLALDNVSMEIAAHEFVAITGPSGCGKSTLMHLIGGLDTPTSGEVFVNGVALHRATDAALTEYRRRSLGIVFQFFNLLPTMTALENVSLPLLLAGQRLEPAREAAAAWLERVGMARCSGLPSPAPWCTGRRSSWPTNPPATSIPPTPPKCSRPCKRLLLSGFAQW